MSTVKVVKIHAATSETYMETAKVSAEVFASNSRKLICYKFFTINQP